MPPPFAARTLTLGLVLLVVPFLPACNLFFRVGFVIAERVLYLSSTGYCLLFAYAVGHCCCRWSKYKVLSQSYLLHAVLMVSRNHRKLLPVVALGVFLTRHTSHPLLE